MKHLRYAMRTRIAAAMRSSTTTVRCSRYLFADSIEQTFVFTQRPTVNGDIIVRITVDGQEMDATDAGSAIEFKHALGSVRYSKALLVDADDNQTNLLTHLNQGTIEIHVPAPLLATSAFPVIIDPVITMFAPYNDDKDNHWPDVAYDDGVNGYMVVWEHQFSETDGDIYAQQLNAAGVPSGPLFFIDLSAENWRKPKVANNNLANNYLVVAQRGLEPNRVIWGRTCVAGSTSMSSPFQIGDPMIPGEQLNADVGGDPALTGPTFYFVVWERVFSAADHDIHGRLMNSNASNAAAVVTIDNSGLSDINARISSSDGLPPFPTQHWTIVWERLFSADDHDIWAAQFRWDGFTTHPSYAIDTSFADHRYPAVSSLLDEDIPQGERRYMVVFEERLNTVAHHIWGRVFRGINHITGADLTALENVPGCSLPPECWAFGPVVESTTDARFAVASIQHNAYVSQLCLSDSLLRVAEQHRPLDTNFDFKVELNLAGVHVNGGNAAREFMAVFNDPFTQVKDDTFGHILGARYNVKDSCCLADVNGDGQINVPDLLLVINQWAAFCPSCAADVNGNLSVGVADLLAVIDGWGLCP